MRKRLLFCLTLAAVLLSITACGKKEEKTALETFESEQTDVTATNDNGISDAPEEIDATDDTSAKPEEVAKKVLNIYAPDTNFRYLFNKYYVKSEPAVLEDVTVNWIIPDGIYQDALDEALSKQSTASADDKVDLFLIDPEYMAKYTDSLLTLDISTIGAAPSSSMYEYTVQVASDSNGVVKGFTYRIDPEVLIYRRSIAKAVIGTDDPTEVQASLDTWEQFAEVAKKAKSAGYYMMAGYDATYSIACNNLDTPWVSGTTVTIPNSISNWLSYTRDLVLDGSCLNVNSWDNKVFEQMSDSGKTMCYFGAPWYYALNMYTAYDEETGSNGDWAICKAPQSSFWSNYWILVASSTDDGELIADIAKFFTENEDMCKTLATKEGILPNNKKVNEALSNDMSLNNTFLGGQNPIGVLSAAAEDIQYTNHTSYDFMLQIGLQNDFDAFFSGELTKMDVYDNFKEYLEHAYSNLSFAD